METEGSSESTTVATAPRRLLNALKILLAGLVIGPPIGGAVAIVALFVQKAVEEAVSQISGWESVGFLAFIFAQTLLFTVILAPWAAGIGYLLGWQPALAGAALFALVDRIAPITWRRPWLGAVCGAIPGPLLLAHEFVQEPRAEFVSTEAQLAISGAVSGWVCAWFCRRVGWTR